MLQNKRLSELVALVANDDFTIASGCVLMAQAAMAFGLIEMSLRITMKHSKEFDFSDLIVRCQKGQELALEYLQEDHQALLRAKQDKQFLPDMLQSSRQQLALVDGLLESLSSLENEVYVKTKPDYLTGIYTLRLCRDCVNNNLSASQSTTL